jgi:hypothetical protein
MTCAVNSKKLVMAGLVLAIHVLLQMAKKTWMPGARPGMTNNIEISELW